MSIRLALACLFVGMAGSLGFSQDYEPKITEKTGFWGFQHLPTLPKDQMVDVCKIEFSTVRSYLILIRSEPGSDCWVELIDPDGKNLITTPLLQHERIIDLGTDKDRKGKEFTLRLKQSGASGGVHFITNFGVSYRMAKR